MLKRKLVAAKYEDEEYIVLAEDINYGYDFRGYVFFKDIEDHEDYQRCYNEERIDFPSYLALYDKRCVHGKLFTNEEILELNKTYKYVTGNVMGRAIKLSDLIDDYKQQSWITQWDGTGYQIIELAGEGVDVELVDRDFAEGDGSRRGQWDLYKFVNQYGGPCADYVLAFVSWKYGRLPIVDKYDYYTYEELKEEYGYYEGEYKEQ